MPLGAIHVNHLGHPRRASARLDAALHYSDLALRPSEDKVFDVGKDSEGEAGKEKLGRDDIKTVHLAVVVAQRDVGDAVLRGKKVHNGVAAAVGLKFGDKGKGAVVKDLVQVGPEAAHVGCAVRGRVDPLGVLPHSVVGEPLFLCLRHDVRLFEPRAAGNDAARRGVTRRVGDGLPQWRETVREPPSLKVRRDGIRSRLSLICVFKSTVRNNSQKTDKGGRAAYSGERVKSSGCASGCRARSNPPCGCLGHRNSGSPFQSSFPQ